MQISIWYSTCLLYTSSALPLVAAAIVGGGLFGDHCSPISDTTVLASIGASCDHVDHFETQMPYAVTVAVICGIMFVLAGLDYSPVMLVVAAVLLTVVVFVLHKLSVKKYGQEKTPGKKMCIRDSIQGFAFPILLCVLSIIDPKNISVKPSNSFDTAIRVPTTPAASPTAVSYTHLDVYKRQALFTPGVST